MKTQEREAREARIEYLEEHLSKVCDLMKFIECEHTDKNFEGLMLLEEGNYLPLVRMQIAIFNAIRSIELEREPISVCEKHRWSFRRVVDQM